MSGTEDPWAWLPSFAERHGLQYEPELDERWLRAFEPFVTLRTPLRYTRALHSTGTGGSLSLARAVFERGGGEWGAWVAFAQDERLPGARVAATSDAPPPTSPFAESLDLISLPRQRTGDHSFDRTFATYAATFGDAEVAITPSLQRLALSWRIPLHFEIRPGVFLLAPVALRADPASLDWLLGAVRFFGEKAAKRVK